MRYENTIVRASTSSAWILTASVVPQCSTKTGLDVPGNCLDIRLETLKF
jgi:hypothetical protein